MKTFEIDIANIELHRVYELNAEIKNSFFDYFESNLISNGFGKVKINYTKTNTMVEVKLSLDVEVELECDRSLNKFMYPILSEHTVFYKFSDKTEEITDDLILIKMGTPYLDLSQVVYDYIGLSIPSKKIHPDLITEHDKMENNDDILIYSSVTNVEESTDNNIDILDPRWEALRKLK
jgi:uncharacterized metal-binding protein YceD (DUF177 family)